MRVRSDGLLYSFDDTNVNTVVTISIPTIAYAVHKRDMPWDLRRTGGPKFQVVKSKFTLNAQVVAGTIESQ